MGKEQENRDPTNPDDDRRGDYRDHVALDPEHRPVRAVVPGARAEEDARAIVAEVKRRVGCERPPSTASDEYPAYATAIEGVFSEPVPISPRSEPGRPRVVPERRPPDDVIHATVHGQRENDRAVAVGRRQDFGTPERPGDVPAGSTASHGVNTPFVGRQDGTDRGRNARRARKTNRFSEDWQVHEAMTYLTLYSDDFRWCARRLRVKDDRGRWRERPPAQAAGLTDHVWTWQEWFTRPAVQSA